MSGSEVSVAQVLVDDEQPTLVRVRVDASAPGEPMLEIVACGPDDSVPRARNAWWTLRGRYPWWTFAISSRASAEALLRALEAPAVRDSSVEAATVLVDAGCTDGCVIRVRAHDPYAEGDAGWVSATYVSTHVGAMHARLPSRLRHAWRALRGDYGWTCWEPLATAELATAIGAAAAAAFPAAAVGGTS